MRIWQIVFVLVLLRVSSSSADKEDSHLVVKHQMILNLQRNRLELHKQVSEVVGNLRFSISESGRLETFDDDPIVLDDEHLTTVVWHNGELKFNEIFPFHNSKVKNARKMRSRCYNFQLAAASQKEIPLACLSIKESGYVYGGGEVFTQLWPMDNQTIKMQPFINNDMLQDDPKVRGLWGSVVERLWVTSNGLGIHIDDDVPLHVGMDRRNLCFMAKFNDSIFESTYQFRSGHPPELNMTICNGPNVKAVHGVMYRMFYKFPEWSPDIRIFKEPIWSTWARYKIFVTQEKVLAFAKEIQSRGFSASQIEIDDMFSTKYGDFDFDVAKFPNPRGMVDELHNMGFRVTAWVMPFGNLDSVAYAQGVAQGVFVKDYTSKEAAVITWWQGRGVTVDMSSPHGYKWYTERLAKFQKDMDLDSFKFDAGETFYLPKQYQTYKHHTTPLQYTKEYVKMASAFGPMIETRVGFNTQDVPIFVRMFDKDSTWGHRNGLRSIIPTALLLSFLGYPFVLPDMIGGNAYLEADIYAQALPSKELYIRWLQMSAFLPAMQFSITPWDYDNETIAIGLKYTKLHEDVVFRALVDAMSDLRAFGAPLIRPLWWLDPTDERALISDSQFLVGGSLMVAPVVEEGAVHRDIFIPSGEWQEGEGSKTIYHGPTMLKDYTAPLDSIPWFTKRPLLLSSD